MKAENGPIHNNTDHCGKQWHIDYGQQTSHHTTDQKLGAGAWPGNVLLASHSSNADIQHGGLE